MRTVSEKVREHALDLPSDDRISLIESLLMSLNLPTRTEIDRLWAEEAEQRVAQIDNGSAKLVPGEKVFAKLRRKYKR